MGHLDISQIPISSLAMLMLFGSITFATVSLATRTWLVGDSRIFSAIRHSRAQPLDTGSFVSIYSLLHHLTMFGLILFFAYICENHPPFPHGEKTYDRDHFFFLITMVFLVSFCTIRKNDTTSNDCNESNYIKNKVHRRELDHRLNALSDRSRNPSYISANDASTATDNYIRPIDTIDDNDLLNRYQTEEWKGWMQIIFLIYHYYHAEEIYNSIRVMITCYVWMTGFGNFSFFYIKDDYSFVRVAQMLWRLNFLVLFLMMTQGTTYILYYIAPLHTFYFLMVYVVMAVAKQLNYTMYGLRIKIACAAFLIFLIWDVDSGLFRILNFPFFGTKPILGATNGALWEWYFRTSLDHWSSLLGMIFAANFPITSLFFRKLEALPPLKCWAGKGAMSIALLSAFILWLNGPFQQDKFQYNATNAYFGVIPLMTYVYFRNLTPTLRAYHLHFLHSIGKITLETYLMQHHIWLTSNSKTVLIFFPGWPKLNMLLITLMYFWLSKYLNRVTLFLRAMILPNNTKGCIRALTLMSMIIGIFFVISALLKLYEFESFGLIGCIVILCGGVLYHIVLDTTWEKFAAVDSTDEPCSSINFDKDFTLPRSFPPLIGTIAILFIGILWQGVSIIGASKVGPLPPQCKLTANDGLWVPIDGCNAGTSGLAYRKNRIVNFATCSPLGSAYSWGWKMSKFSKRCRFTQRSSSDLQRKLRHRRVVFVGDSITRYLYHAFCRQMGIVEAGKYDTSGPKHSDIDRIVGKTEIDFKWAPFAFDQVLKMKELNDFAFKNDVLKYDLVVIGGGPWDVLWKFQNPDDKQNTLTYLSQLQREVESMTKMDVPVVWNVPTTMNDPALNTPEKRDRMTEAHVEQMRNIHEEKGLLKSASFVIDGPSFSRGRVHESYDGVHYPLDVYDAGGQILSNALDWLFPEKSPQEPFSAPEPGKMANPCLGVTMLLICSIGLFFFDGFFGLSYLASLFIRGLRPSNLYVEAFTILHEKAKLPSISFSQENSVSSYESDTTEKTKNTPNGLFGHRSLSKRSRRRYSSTVNDEIAVLLDGDLETSNRQT
jgi:N-acetylneuraminate 9-O-acetyltransferase